MAELHAKYELASKAWLMLPNEVKASHQKENILRALAEIHQEFEKLARYSRVNDRAMSRIFSKIERSSDSLGKFYHEQKSVWRRSQANVRKPWRPWMP